MLPVFSQYAGTALTPDQIRLINRLTKNITVLFDGDAAGLRASLRGIDLILEEGMNVRVCSFPDGEDPDSFAKKYNFEEITHYLESNSKDFIQFKASLLMEDAKNDPIKKADLIREIVVSISKVPDRIQREVYIQECSRIMDISEQVLVSTLAQLIQKDIVDAGKKQKQDQKSLEVVKEETTPNAARKIDVQYEIERKIIEILLLYGNTEDEFEDTLLRTNAEGEVEEYTEKRTYKVFERVYLSLQEDEVELANPLFRAIFNNIINYFRQAENFSTEQYLMQLPQELAQEVTDVLMEDEKVVLHNWEAQNIIVKEKTHSIGQYVNETILTLRWFLVDKIIEELKKDISSEPNADNTETLSLAMDYYKLIGSFSSKLGRVMSRYHI
ncbi:MAG: toprim domain-containing protein [Flavobacterium sp.]|nr:MAG: toprim domain-containing protein [Flavobacterium sp.]